MIRWLAVLGALILSGCTHDPATPRPAPKYPRMAMGTPAIVYDVATVDPPDGGRWQEGDREFIYLLSPGDRVLILDDDQSENWEDRRVRARVETGTLAGNTYRIRRSELRPVSR